MNEEIEKIKRKKEELERQLSDTKILRNPEKVKELSIEFSKIERELAALSRLEEVRRQIAEARALVESPDAELAALAAGDLGRLQKEEIDLSRRLTPEEKLPDSLIMELRAGAGGDEAALFAAELFVAYSHYAERHKWSRSMISESRSDLGGYKEIIFEIAGEDAYRSLRWESGVHRVQRIPATEKSGRVHTSTVSVAVLPKAREIDMEIKPQDIKVEFFRSSGPGGQNVNKVETAVRLYHLPSGLVVVSQNERSQQQNRERALGVLRARLLDHRVREEQKKMAAERKAQIGTGDRSEKIRTYNFPQDRVTDHRIKESWHNISSLMAGNLDPIIEALTRAAQ